MPETLSLFRYSSNAWGQQVLEGMSWDLLPVFFWAGLVFIILHALLMWFFPSSKNK